MNISDYSENLELSWYRIMAYSTNSKLGTYCAVYPETTLMEVYQKVSKQLKIDLGSNQHLLFSSSTRISDDPYDSVLLLGLTQEGQILEISICEADESIQSKT